MKLIIQILIEVRANIGNCSFFQESIVEKISLFLWKIIIWSYHSFKNVAVILHPTTTTFLLIIFLTFSSLFFFVLFSKKLRSTQRSFYCESFWIVKYQTSTLHPIPLKVGLFQPLNIKLGKWVYKIDGASCKTFIYRFVGINSLHSLFSMNFFPWQRAEKSYILWKVTSYHPLLYVSKEKQSLTSLSC